MYEHSLLTEGSANNLTLFERSGLNKKFNLSDGHAHQRQNQSQQKIIARLSETFYRAETMAQSDLERDFLTSFFRLAGQPQALEYLDYCMLCFSASTATEIVAHVLKQRKLKTAVIEPTFDNIPAILRRVGVEIVAIDEAAVFPEPDLELISSLNIEALFIVMPNNPTGCFMNKQWFVNLLHFCAENRILLIADFCFRFFVDDMTYEQYQLAIDSGIDFIFIEDTGKTWSTLELKIGFLTVSKSLLQSVNNIHSDFLLNISPFTLILLKEYIEDTLTSGINTTINNIISPNRKYLRSRLSNTHLQVCRIESKISVEWLKILSHVNARQLISILKDNEVYVLPGMPFYWLHPQYGEKYVRVALMRDRAIFEEAVDALVDSFPLR